MLVPLFSINLLFTFVTADYICLCNYHVERTVYPSKDNQGTALGHLYEFDCKPTYQSSATSGWQAIQYEKKVGYVSLDEQTKVQTCPGNPSSEDLVLATTPTMIPVTSTFSSKTAYTRLNAISSLLVNSTPTNFYTTLMISTMFPSVKNFTTVTPTMSTSKVSMAEVSLSISPARTAYVSSLHPSLSRSSTTTTMTVRPRVCPPRVPRSRYLLEFGQHCYEFVLGKASSWPEAEQDCQNKGGHLVSISSPSEQTFVYSNLKLLHFHGDSGVWIGFTDHHHEGHWYWSSGERVTYTNWLKGQPGLFGAFEDCAVMEAEENGQWGDYSCEGILLSHEKHEWVCEYDKMK